MISNSYNFVYITYSKFWIRWPYKLQNRKKWWGAMRYNCWKCSLSLILIFPHFYIKSQCNNKNNFPSILLFINSIIYLSIEPSIDKTIHWSIHCFNYPSIYLSISIQLSIIFVSIYSNIYCFINLSIYFIYSLLYQSIYLIC